MLLSFPLPLVKVAVPEKPLPPPEGPPEVNGYDLPAVVFLHVPVMLTAVTQPALLFMATVAVALVMVLVLGTVEKFTVGVMPVV